ncbi:MAG: type IV pilin protein [Nevskia sp.]|nr:type IV pilin protein [Nevskia sp.]
MRQKGFSMKELMIAVLILAIITTLAVRNFGKSRLKTNRENGVACLVEVQKRIEDYYNRYFAYPTLSQIGYSSGNCPITQGSTQLYTISINTTTAVANCTLCYSLTASPSGVQAQDESKLLLTIDPRDPSTSGFTTAYHKQHVTPAGVTEDGWIFQPGQ